MLRVQTAAELPGALNAIDITISTVAEERTTEAFERHGVVRLLATLPLARLEFPLALIHREPPADRPDFLLTMGTRSIGIEHTRAVPQNEAHAQHLRRAGHGEDVYFVRRAEPGEPRRSRAQLLREIEPQIDQEKDDAMGDGWVGDSPDREWAAGMAAAVSLKVASAAQPGFTRFAENWLLIYDEWPLPDFNPENAGGLLLAEAQAAFDTFDCIFVVNASRLWRLSRGELSVYGE